MFSSLHMHPMFVHFPIALAFVGFIFEIVGLVLQRDDLKKLAGYLLFTAAVASVIAVVTGSMAEDIVGENGPAAGMLESHEGASQVAMWLLIAASAARLLLAKTKDRFTWLKPAAIVLFFAAVVAIGVSGYFGGKMVYELGAGIENHASAPQVQQIQHDKN